MGIKKKLSAILPGAAGAGLLAGGGVEEAKAYTFYDQYNADYNKLWTSYYNVWKNPNSDLRLQYPFLSMFEKAFNSAFNVRFGYLLGDAAPYQNSATVLFALGAATCAASAYLFYKYKKQSKADNPVSKKE